LSKKQAEPFGSRLTRMESSPPRYWLKCVSFENTKMNSKIFLSNKGSGILQWHFLCYRHSCTTARSNWVAFIDSSNVSLKALLWSKRNKFPSVPLQPVPSTWKVLWKHKTTFGKGPVWKI
jgi:hypothetical protein